MVTPAGLLRPDRLVDLLLIMLANLTVKDTTVPSDLQQYVTRVTTW